MKQLIAIFFAAFTVLVFSQEEMPFEIGKTVKIHSEILNEDRTINIFLPHDYALDTATSYHVIYLLDGSADEDFIHVAGLVQFYSFSWIGAIPPTIVVGISNVDRRRDFTFPTTNEQDKKDNPTSGGSALFMKFLSDELVPYMDKNYRLNPDRTIIGQSLGGLLATEILFTNPELFKNYFIISPSLWWDNQSILERKWAQVIGNKRIYIAVGDEGKLMVPPAKKLYSELKKTGGNLNTLYFEFFKNRTHGDVLHEALEVGFEKIFNEH
jgi:predicted alpha/beta superfamily hydrolase